ncbi:MAG: DUF1269 domain-containing protein [Pseudomonadota bacterium]
MGTNDLFVYAAVYEDEASALSDLELFFELAVVGVVGKFDTAILTKDADGKVHVEKHGTAAASGAWKGLLAGGLVGLLFPPSILVGSLVGGASGALVGKLWGGMSRTNLKEIGETLDQYETGLVIVGESTIDALIEKTLKKAKKRVRKELEATLKDIEKEMK